MDRIKSIIFAIVSSLLVLGACTNGFNHIGPRPDDPLTSLSAVTNGTKPGIIVDEQGRQVLLRGVNFNTHIEYWQYDTNVVTNFPFTNQDADLMAAMGWNMARVCISWSRVEPQPGEYDETYLDEVEVSINKLAKRGIYTLLDLHQDAWAANLAALPGTVCDEGSPVQGWDGAPEWATFDDGASRCGSGHRELMPAVRASFVNFWKNKEGPGGVGIQTRYVKMFAHLVKRYGNNSAVAGYDVMNEPNQFLEETYPLLSKFYEDALKAMRQAEKEVGAPKRLFFFEPTIAWHAAGFPPPANFEHDDQVVYSPHLYQEGINEGLLEDAFARAAQESVELYGGAPVVTSEWGTDPLKAKDSTCTYHVRHLSEQENYQFGALIWSWHTSCGDPHIKGMWASGKIAEAHPWGFFNQDCSDNTWDGMRTEYVEVMKKMAVRFAPGPIEEIKWNMDDSGILANGTNATKGNRLEVFLPTDEPETVEIKRSGLGKIKSVPWFGGTLIYAKAQGGSWSIEIISLEEI